MPGDAPEDLHPALWRASQLGRPRAAGFASGFAELDAVLPGGGWPARALTELLLPHPGMGELRLLAPALAALQAQERSVLWFDPPGQPSAWALEALGIRTRWLVLVRSRVPLSSKCGSATLLDPHGGRAGRSPAQGAFMSKCGSATLPDPHGGWAGRSPALGAFMGRARERLPAADLLWALEQALASGQAGAVLAWLPARLGVDALRRLQLAAQAHDGPAFLLRDAEARLRPSVAPLRLLLAGAGPQCPDRLRVHLLKRRGPPLARPLELALPSVLAPSMLARLQRPAAAPATASPALPSLPSLLAP